MHRCCCRTIMRGQGRTQMGYIQLRHPSCTITTVAHVQPTCSCAQGLARRDLMQLTAVPPLPRSSPAGTASSAGTSRTPAFSAAAVPSPARAPPQQQQESVFARMGCGMAIHFSPEDPRMYLAATEDGPVHRHGRTNTLPYEVSMPTAVHDQDQWFWHAYSGRLLMSIVSVPAGVRQHMRSSIWRRTEATRGRATRCSGRRRCRASS